MQLVLIAPGQNDPNASLKKKHRLYKRGSLLASQEIHFSLSSTILAA
jgi:hypothetical protein